ncbi:histone-lysine N-methyltransferase SETMAR [Nephila pilipes]|uniref:Histone-lysine N-methyltransferase SETMAR n=1 Tax=Nephila pilipes TaxID=299642 RepID=A0A8X6NKI0_NEPPI|nr:histone-lysine N-methyltransferase SETMAR [Nephila pilipes]
MYNVSKQTILTHLSQIGTVEKLDKWIPRASTNAQKEEACLSLLSCNKAEPFLNQIITCDEKWITYDKRSSQWLDKDEPPKHCPKRDIHQKTLMVTVWRSGSGVIHHSFMEPGQSITANLSG